MWVYIWNDTWLPWANTIAYYPLNSDFNDHKSDLWIAWTTYNATMRNSFSYNFITEGIWNCIQRTNSWNASMETWIMLWTIFTVMFYLNMTTDNWRNVYWWNKSSDSWYWFSLQFDHTKPWIKVYQSHYYADNNITTNARHHIALTQSWTTAILYVDWVWKTFTVDWNSWPVNFRFLWIFNAWTACKMDELYVFNSVLTAQEISGYYNQTKSQYWIN